MSQSQAEEFVTLASPDGFEFVLPRDAACVSGTIRRMLDPESQFISKILFAFVTMLSLPGIVCNEGKKALYVHASPLSLFLFYFLIPVPKRYWIESFDFQNTDFWPQVGLRKQSRVVVYWKI